jgi:cytochrome c553
VAGGEVGVTAVRRAAIAFTLLLLVAACSTAMPVQQEVRSQDISGASADVPFMIQPQHYDLGVVTEGQQAHARLFVRNTGMLPLHIAEVQSACGCTVGSLGSQEVPPGGFTPLDVSVDTTAKGNLIEKKISVVDALGRHADAWLTLRVVENKHPGSMNGSIFTGKCASCHAEPATGKIKGEDIYAAVCIMCHGKAGKGAYAPKLRGLDAKVVHTTLQHGINTRMPAFSRKHGGPLTARQIAELARWLSGLDE